MNNRYTHILLDLDRTLWDMDTNSHETMSELFAKHISTNTEVKCTFNQFWEAYTPINDALWERMRQGTVDKQQLRYERIKQTMTAVGIDNLFTPNTINKIGVEYTNTAPLKTNLVANAIEILNYLTARNYQLHIITNGFKEAQLLKLKQCNIAHYFKHIIISEDVGISKPNIRFFNAALAIIKATASQCLVVGDDLLVDCQGATNAGIDAVWYNPHNAINTTNNSAIIQIKNLNELQQLV